jgi:hypothetical protein
MKKVIVITGASSGWNTFLRVGNRCLTGLKELLPVIARNRLRNRGMSLQRTRYELIGDPAADRRA